MEIIAVFDGTICKKGGLKCGNTTIAPKGREKTIEDFIFTLGRRWGKQEIRNHMKDPNGEKADYGDIETVYDHLGLIEAIQASQDAQAGFIVGFIKNPC